MYNGLINNWNIIRRLFYDYDNNYSWPMPKYSFLSRFDLNKNTLDGQIRRYTKRGVLKKGDDYIIEGLGGNGTTTYIYEDGAKKILERMQSIEGAKFLSKFGKLIHLKKCFLYKNIIKYAVKGGDDPKSEFPLNDPNFPNYKIDLYLKIKKLAIECDELGHEHEPLEKRSNRQQAIEKKLGCTFLRFNPHEKDFDIGLVIKVIYHYLLDKKINGEDPIEYYNKLKVAAIQKMDFIDLSDEF